MPLTDINLKEIVDSAVKVLKCNMATEEKKITIVADQVTDEYVRANTLLKDVIDNLLESTIRRVHYNGTIWLSSKRNDPLCMLILEDNGPGMIETPGMTPQKIVPAENLHEIPSISMYFVFSIVKHYGGSVTIEERVPGELEQGNRIILTFKCAGTSK
jgi:sensor histidine kinase regulating citrate/malate metabolism